MHRNPQPQPQLLFQIQLCSRLKSSLPVESSLHTPETATDKGWVSDGCESRVEGTEEVVASFIHNRRSQLCSASGPSAVMESSETLDKQGST